MVEYQNIKNVCFVFLCPRLKVLPEKSPAAWHVDSQIFNKMSVVTHSFGWQIWDI